MSGAISGLEQVRLSRQFTREMAEDNSSNFTELTVAIRNHVRDDLGLKDLGDDINILRIDPFDPKKNRVLKPD